MSTTPRTDALLRDAHDSAPFVEFARQLEREVRELQSALSVWEDENAGLSGQLATAQEDSRRLDWLDANMGRVIPGSGDARYWILGQKEFAPNKATSLRAAIDAKKSA